MKRRRLLILTGFLLALAAMLPVTALAGSWAVVCSNVQGQSHLEFAHGDDGCVQHDSHPGCTAPDQHPDPQPCEDRTLDLDDYRVPDRPTDLSTPTLPVTLLTYPASQPMPAASQAMSHGMFSFARTGPPPGVTTTILRL